MSTLSTSERIFSEELQAKRESGTPVVDLSVFNPIQDFKITPSIQGRLDYTLELYEEALKKIKSLGEEYEQIFLKTVKENDIIDNQKLENEDVFLLEFFRKMHVKSAIDGLIAKKDKKITPKEFVKFHDLLLQGTSSKDLIGLRENDNAYVGYVDNNEIVVQYFPILHEQIDKAVEMFLAFYNYNKFNSQNPTEALLNPILYHGLLASLQLFRDGNTRYGRLMEHVELWNGLNKTLSDTISSPFLFSTTQYAPYYEEYRNLVARLAINKDTDSYEEWIKYNLRRIQDSLYQNDERVSKLLLRK